MSCLSNHAALQQVERVVVVVNGCADDTAERAQDAGAEVISSAPGYARALACGYAAQCAFIQP